MAANRSPTQITMMLRRPTNGTDHAVYSDLAKAAGVRVEWLAEGIGPRDTDAPSDPYDDPQTMGAHAFLAELDTYPDRAELVAFVASYNARPHKDGPVEASEWRDAYRAAWREHRHAAKAGGRGLGIGVRVLK